MVLWLQVEEETGHFTNHSASELARLIQKQELVKRTRCIVMVEQEWHRSRYQIELLKITMHIFKWAVEVCRCRRISCRYAGNRLHPPPQTLRQQRRRTAYNEDSPSSSSYDDLSDDEDDHALAEIAEMEYRSQMERAGTMPVPLAETFQPPQEVLGQM